MLKTSKFWLYLHFWCSHVQKKNFFFCGKNFVMSKKKNFFFAEFAELPSCRVAEELGKFAEFAELQLGIAEMLLT